MGPEDTEFVGCPHSGGSYSSTCRHCSVSSSCILSCDCGNGHGGVDHATYNLNDCNDLSNNHGKLQCSSHSCAAHPACAAAGLSGDCCPTSDGVTLGCCSSHAEVTANATVLDATVSVTANATVPEDTEFVGCPHSGGSYSSTCRHCSVSSSCIMSCECGNGHGGWPTTTYNLNDCTELSNKGGKLQCS